MTLKRSLIILLFSSLVLSPVFAETYFGGEEGASLQFRTDSETGLHTDLRDDLHLYVSSYQDAFSLYGDLSLSSTLGSDTAPEVSFGIVELYGEFYLSDDLILKVGSFIDRAGHANLLSPLNLFHATDYERLFMGDLEHLLRPDHLVKLSWFSDYLSIDCIVAPLITPPVQLSADSSWFPVSQFPLSIEKANGDIKVLGDITYNEPEFIQDSLDDMSFQLRISGSTMALDWSVLGFYGYDRDMTHQVVITNFADSTDVYNITLEPVESKKAVIGTTFSTSLGEMVLHGDASYTFGKVFGTEWLHLSGSIFTPDAQQVMEEAQALNYSVGADLDFGGLNTLVSFEVIGMSAFSEEEVTLPLFSRLFSVVTNTVNSDYTLSLNTVTLFSMEDESGVFYPSLMWDPTAEVSLTLSLPLFFGDLRSEFGQYSEGYHTMVKGLVRF